MSSRPPIPADESERLAAVHHTGLLDSAPEPLFDTITDLVAAALGAPIALINLVDEDRQWIKAKTGFTGTEAPRDVTICAYAILAPDELLVVEDASRDPRFADSPLVTGPPHIRFYAGAPLRVPGGQPVGTLCIIDTEPRRFDPHDADLLRRAALQVESLLEARFERDQAVGEHNRITTLHGQLEAAAEARTRFLAVAQHKLKTPLAVISGWSSTLQEWDRLEPDERTVGLDAIHRSAMELRDQIDDLLDEARANLLERSIQPVPIEVAILLDDQLGRLRSDEDRHPITVDVADDLTVLGDEVALRQILAHLLDNAIKYSPDGGSIQVAARSSGDDRCIISVRDHGIGLPGDVDVFEPFQRGASATGVARGTGLGLYIVRSLTTSMGGAVEATDLGDGALIEISLRSA